MTTAEGQASLRFRRLVAAHAASAAGDTLIAIALAGTLFFDVPTGEARAQVALYLVLTMAPFALLAPLIGPMIDRKRGGHRLAVAAAGAGRAALALFMASTGDTVLLYPAAFGALVLSRAHSVARGALVPAIVDTHGGSVWANARLARVSVLAAATAAVPGVLSQRLGGAPVTLTIAALVFALTVTAAIALPKPPRRRPDAAGVIDRRPPLRVARAMVVNAVIRGTGGFLLFLLAFGLRERGVGAAGFALVIGASGAGAFIGATVVPRLRRSGNEEWILAVAPLLGAGSALIAARAFGTDLAALVGGTVGVLTNAGRLALDSLAQRLVAEAARARMFARLETFLQLCWVAGALLALIPFPIGVGLALASGAYLTVAGWFLVTLGAEGRRGLTE